MNGRGAVELIIASVGLEMGIIDDNLFSILVIIAFFYHCDAAVDITDGMQPDEK
jgi:hypothetical protein